MLVRLQFGSSGPGHSVTITCHISVPRVSSAQDFPMLFEYFRHSTQYCVWCCVLRSPVIAYPTEQQNGLLVFRTDMYSQEREFCYAVGYQLNAREVSGNGVRAHAFVVGTHWQNLLLSARPAHSVLSKISGLAGLWCDNSSVLSRR